MSVVSNDSRNNNSSILGSLAKGSLKIVEKTGCVLGGVSLITLGCATFAFTTFKVYQFGIENSAGLGDVPQFKKTCDFGSELLNSKFNWPGVNSTFCEEISNAPFSELPLSHKPAAAVAAIGLSLLSYTASLHMMVAGTNLITRSFEW